MEIGHEEVQDVNLRLVSEERDLFCQTCTRVFKDKMFLLVLDDKTQAVASWIFPTKEKPYRCKECASKVEGYEGPDSLTPKAVAKLKGTKYEIEDQENGD